MKTETQIAEENIKHSRMKQTKFEKVVEGDEEELMYVWIYGLLSICIPLSFLIITNVHFLGIVLLSFVDGMLFIGFVSSISEYLDSRKVYWRKIE